MKEKQFIIRRGLSDNCERQLIINEDFLKFENKDLVNHEFTTFLKEDIAEYSFGVKWMRYKFVFGREYVIFIRNHNNQIIKINFKTYFGRKKEEYHQLCNDILTALWDSYFDKITSNFIKKQEAGDEFKIGEVTINKEGVTIITNTSIKQKPQFIPWNKVSIKDYVTYFSIYAQDDAINCNRGYSYLNDWNTAVIHSFLKHILKTKNGIENI